MKLFKLLPTRQPGASIDNFESLTWTERYRDSGDFELIIKNEANSLNILPRGTLISHTDTREVMIVEDHQIDEDTEKKEIIFTFSGRSFETFAENRTTVGSDLPLKDDITGEDIVEVTASLSSAEVVRNLLKARLEPGTASADEAIPYLSIGMVMRVLDAAMEHIVKRGDAYSRALEFLGLCDGGLKNIRPLVNETNMSLTVHDGIDRRQTVVFYAQREDLENTKYFWSDRKYRNYARLTADTESRLHRHRDLASDLTGLDRRILYVEASDIIGDYGAGSPSDAISARAQTALDGKKRLGLLSTSISERAKPKFKIDYDVGDLVTVFGNYSASASMRVTEHILIVDEKGTHGNPSLSTV